MISSVAADELTQATNAAKGTNIFTEELNKKLQDMTHKTFKQLEFTPQQIHRRLITTLLPPPTHTLRDPGLSYGLTSTSITILLPPPHILRAPGLFCGLTYFFTTLPTPPPYSDTLKDSGWFCGLTSLCITLLPPPPHIQRDSGLSCGLTSPSTTPILQPPFTLGDPGLLVDLPFLPQPNFLHHHTL